MFSGFNRHFPMVFHGLDHVRNQPFSPAESYLRRVHVLPQSALDSRIFKTKASWHSGTVEK